MFAEKVMENKIKQVCWLCRRKTRRAEVSTLFLAYVQLLPKESCGLMNSMIYICDQMLSLVAFQLNGHEWWNIFVPQIFLTENEHQNSIRCQPNIHTHKSVYGSYDKHTCKYALQPLILLIGTYTAYICTTYDPT